jgi:hypothetical protein
MQQLFARAWNLAANLPCIDAEQALDLGACSRLDGG